MYDGSATCERGSQPGASVPNQMGGGGCSFFDPRLNHDPLRFPPSKKRIKPNKTGRISKRGLRDNTEKIGQKRTFPDEKPPGWPVFTASQTRSQNKTSTKQNRKV